VVVTDGFVRSSLVPRSVGVHCVNTSFGGTAVLPHSPHAVVGKIPYGIVVGGCVGGEYNTVEWKSLDTWIVVESGDLRRVNTPRDSFLHHVSRRKFITRE
jgi:hypothetical protein